jgi:hypothetical protein
MAAEPLENDLEAHHPVGRGAGAAEFVPFGGETHEFDLPPEEAQGREKVLGLLDWRIRSGVLMFSAYVVGEMRR